MEAATETSPLRLILETVDELKRFTDDKWRVIEDYYRYNDSGDVFHSPMIVCAQHIGAENRGDWMLQNNDYLVARLYTDFAFRNDGTPLVAMLEKFVHKTKAEPFESHAAVLLTIQQARKANIDLDALEDAVLAPLSDRFYPDYQHFVQKLLWLREAINNVSQNPKAWDDELHTIFRQHARHLIHVGRMTPVSFTLAHEAQTKKTHTNEMSDECSIDIDYVYKAYKLFSAYTRTAIGSFDGNKHTFTQIIYSEKELVEKLSVYLGELRYPEIISRFAQIFGEIYLAEVDFLKAQRVVESRHAKDETNPWTLTQFWTNEQKQHHLQMTQVRSEICSLPQDQKKDVAMEKRETSTGV